MNKEQIERILIEIFKEHSNEYVFSKFDSDQSRDNFIKALAEELFNKVKDVPSADVAPVVHGKWIPIVSYFHGKPDGRYYCSVCHRVVNKLDNFCPSCGADMRGEHKNV